MPERLARHAGARLVRNSASLLWLLLSRTSKSSPCLFAERHQALLRALAHRAPRRRRGSPRRSSAPPARTRAARWRRAARASRGRAGPAPSPCSAPSSASTSASDSDFGKRGARLGGSSLSVGSTLMRALAQVVLVEALERRHAPRRARGASLARAEESEQVGFSRFSSVVFFRKPVSCSGPRGTRRWCSSTARPRARARRRTRRASRRLRL